MTAPATTHELLRLATAGSVDDGKSTLIGRLLLDTKLLLSDHRDAVSRDGEAVEEATVRYRTVGDLTVTGAVRSEAADSAAVIAEIEASRISERGETRADDRTSEAAMEDRKREGYF